MKVLSLFSGVGGFDLGLERAGMETVFQCEWDKHATKILEKHWPHVPRWDDVSTLTGEHILNHAPVIDVVAWGSPCQDLSVAGKRAGLQGARSGLFHEGVRIIKELRELTNGKYPRISIWENVAGALSSGAGADFGQVLTEMDEAGACFSEWRILDAQYFGVPQRRRRVFLISVFDPATAARCPDPLLPVSESVQWHSQTSATASNTTAPNSTFWVDRAGWNQGRNAKFPIVVSDKNVVPSLTVGVPHAVFDSADNLLLLDGTRVNDVRVYESPVQTLKSRMGTGGNNVPVIVGQQSVFPRRLTPLECERLMGWPDDWTAGQSDTHRYKQCGNGVVSPVATWIGERLMELDQ